MAKFTADQKKELKTAFDNFDLDKNGEITVSELTAAFKRMNRPMSKMQIANIMSKADTDGNGTIDFEEFCALKTRPVTAADFKKYDKNGDNYLGPDEVACLAKDLGFTHASAKAIKIVMDSLDKDKDGKISFEEFKDLNQC